jgi:hypothetical protein
MVRIRSELDPRAGQRRQLRQVVAALTVQPARQLVARVRGGPMAAGRIPSAEPHDHGGHWCGHIGSDIGQRTGLFAANPRQPVKRMAGVDQRMTAREQLVERDTQPVQVAAGGGDALGDQLGARYGSEPRMEHTVSSSSRSPTMVMPKSVSLAVGAAVATPGATSPDRT